LENYLSRLADVTAQDKLDILISLLDSTVYEYIRECSNYDDAMSCLDNVFVKPVNEVYARQRLNTCQQKPGESIDEFLQRLKALSVDCNFTDVSAVQCKEAAVRDAFVAGLRSAYIRQRLLEDNVIELRATFERARTLCDALKNAEEYNAEPSSNTHSPESGFFSLSKDPAEQLDCAASREGCAFCGKLAHLRSKCPARQRFCYKCGRKGHFAPVCRSKDHPYQLRTGVCNKLALAPCSSHPSFDDDKVNVFISVNGVLARCLLDTGAERNHVNLAFFRRAGLAVTDNHPEEIGLAVKGSSVKTHGSCRASIKLKNRCYEDVSLSVTDGLQWDVIIGSDFLKEHESVNFTFGGPERPLKLGTLEAAKVVKPVRLFGHITADCKPVASKSRHYSKTDEEFIANKVSEMLRDGVIESSSSPWRTQVVIVKSEHHKKRLCIDYSQTINKFTLLDAYPLSNVWDDVNNVAQYKWFCSLDLKCVSSSSYSA